MIYGYARVSTKGQSTNGNSLNDQASQLRARGCMEIYMDSFTGTTIDRPEFTKLLGKLKAGDLLMVTKLDRFARNAAEGAKTVQELVNRGVDVDILNMGRANNSSTGKLLLSILFAFAEFERDQILERTSAGKAVAKANDPNWREGRKAIETPEFEKFLEKTKRGVMTIKEACEALGISRRTWYNRVKDTKG